MVSADPFFTSSPRAANKSSTLPGSPNHPSRSAIRWRLLQPSHLATTTPFSYDSRQAVLTDLVSHTLHVNTMARSCLLDVFKLETAEWVLGIVFDDGCDFFSLGESSFSTCLLTIPIWTSDENDENTATKKKNPNILKNKTPNFRNKEEENHFYFILFYFQII